MAESLRNWEFYGEEEAFCLSRIACFGPLTISRPFRQLCQHQAHAGVAADFHNTQNGTSQESDTFPIKFLHLASSSMFSIDNYMCEKNQVIKRKRQKKTFFQRTFLNNGKTTNSSLSDSQYDVLFFRYQNIHKF